MVTLKKLFLLIIINLGMALSLSAQELKVVSTGQGTTEDEATKIALRSALEDAYGTFISSSTKIENDVLVSDEIVSLTQGNIKEYDVVNSSQLANGLYSVTVESIISLNELATYCQSKGMNVSFNGKAFGMELKMKEFNRKNEIKILKNLCIQIMAMNPQICDYELKNTDPRVFNISNYNTWPFSMNPKFEDWIDKHNSNIFVKVLVCPKTNTNFDTFENLIQSTLKSIALNKNEIKALKKMGLESVDTNLAENYQFRDANAIKILEEFYFAFREMNTLNWIFKDGIKGNVFGIDLRFQESLVFHDSFENDDYLQDMGIKADFIPSVILSQVDPDFKINGYYYPKNCARKLTFLYTDEDIAKIQEFRVEPFNKKAYETIIKPKLLNIIAEFDNIK